MALKGKGFDHFFFLADGFRKRGYLPFARWSQKLSSRWQVTFNFFLTGRQKKKKRGYLSITSACQPSNRVHFNILSEQCAPPRNSRPSSSFIGQQQS